MEEKIKIYVPESINSILVKDMENFEFYKNDGTFNKNEFYNTLIYNYHEQYQQFQSALFENIKKTIATNTTAPELTVNDLAQRILDYVDIKANRLDEEKSEVTLSIKPTRLTADTFNFIENYCIGESTLSSYFRNMFASYSLFPQDKRERIVFRKNFELLETAIKDKRKIYFTTAGKDATHVASPYSVENSKEELFNYLLAEEKGSACGFRVGRIRQLKILNEPASFAEKNIAIFDKMAEQGPQYTYNGNTTDSEIKIFLTNQGKAMYKSMYTHRPLVSRIDGDFYYFNCSSMQAYQYFRRFGNHAIAVEPKELTEQLFKFYSAGENAYYKLNTFGKLNGKKYEE